MLTIIIMRMGLNALRHHMIRSLLTLLGIVIGIAGIITINSVGKGAQQRAREQFLAYGSKAVSLSQGNWMSPSQKEPKQFHLSDMNMIQGQCPTLEYISPVVRNHQAQIEFHEQKLQNAITGGNEYMHLIDERTLLKGSFFTKQHVERKENVTVIPDSLATTLFKRDEPIGKIIRIKGAPFVVVGVLAPKKMKGKWDGLRPPEILIPFTTHMKYFNSLIFQFDMSTYQESQVDLLVRQLEKIFRAAHNLEPGQPNDFMVFNLQAFAQEAEKASKSVGLFALIAALIALIVGGIGVMNVMLIAVKERTKEIGVKMALGATTNIIRLQFLFESVVICMLGGTLGVAFGIAASWGLNRFMGVLTITEPLPVVAAFLVSTLIGLVFGFYPAELAARLRPVKALTDY